MKTIIEPMTAELPNDFGTLRAEAAQEGFRFIERLTDEWNEGINVFDKLGEVLVVARCNGEIAGVGGTTIDPVEHSALRMRRFYIRPAYRRLGIGKEIANTLIEDAKLVADTITVNAGTRDAPAFWEALGFIRCRSEHLTHVLVGQ